MTCERCGGRMVQLEELACLNCGRRRYAEGPPPAIVPEDMQGQDLTDRSPLTLADRRVRHTERQRRYRQAMKENAGA